MANSNRKTFVKITNQDIYEKLEKVHQATIKTTEMVQLHQKWLWGLTGAFASGFIFLVGMIVK